MAEVGGKRKGREGFSSKVSKKRIVDTSDKHDKVEKEEKTSVKKAKQGGNKTAPPDIKEDYVLVNAGGAKERPVSKPNKRGKKKNAVNISPDVTTSSKSVNKASQLLPSLSPPPTISKPVAKVDLLFDTFIDSPESTGEIHPSFIKKSSPKKDSLSWITKLIILFSGIALSVFPFVWFWTNDTLALAALSGQAGVVKVMLNMGADVDVLNDNGETLLLEACRLENWRAVQLFLESGSNIEAVNSHGETALCLVLGQSNYKIGNLLIKSGANVDVRLQNGDTLLTQAVRKGDFVKSQFLIDAGADVEVVCKSGETPVVIAFETNHIAIANALLDAGANIDVSLSSGGTLLTQAVFYNNNKVQVLLDAGANVEATSQDGISKPLFLAAVNGNQEVIKMLLSKGADTEASNRENWTPLLLSTDLARNEIVDILISAGADVNASTKADGKTCLMWAILKGHDDIAKALIEAGADVGIKSKAGNTALNIAHQYGRKSMEDFLAKRSRNNLTPVMRRDT